MFFIERLLGENFSIVRVENLTITCTDQLPYPCGWPNIGCWYDSWVMVRWYASVISALAQCWWMAGGQLVYQCKRYNGPNWWMVISVRWFANINGALVQCSWMTCGYLVWDHKKSMCQHWKLLHIGWIANMIWTSYRLWSPILVYVVKIVFLLCRTELQKILK